MGHEDLVIIGNRVMGALVIGALIGIERTFHGPPSGISYSFTRGASKNDAFLDVIGG